MNIQNKDVETEEKKLLLITVGGAIDPIVKSVKEYRPEKVLFIASKESKEEFKTKVGINEEFPFLKENYDFLILDDPQDMKKIIKCLKDKAEPEHKKWLDRGEEYSSVVDITGGTKCMSASLALVARNWEKYVFSYVGGNRRDKEGMGVVQRGFEKIIRRHNPWEILGYQSIDEAALLFNRCSYSEAYNVLEKAFESMTKNIKGDQQSPVLKEEFRAAKTWIKAYREWDNFNHKEALGSLKLKKSLNNLNSVFKIFDLDFEKNIDQAEKYLNKILNNYEGETGSLKNSPYLIFDLIVNAQRRSDQGRFDDAVARLYRAIEAIAQYRLQEKYQIDSAKVDISFLTPKLKEKYSHVDPPKLALQDCYLLLSEKSDDLGKKFKRLDLFSYSPELKNENLSVGYKENLLAIRNTSILAHGFNPLSENDFKKLLNKAIELFSVLKEGLEEEKELFDFEKKDKPPFFPKLKGRSR